MIAQKFDIPGFHYNPAISLKQVRDNVENMFLHNKSKQRIYKTHLDFASPHAHNKGIKKNFEVKHVGTSTEKGMDKMVISAHNIEHFSPEIKEVVGESSVKVERNTTIASLKKGGTFIAKGAGGGIQAYFTYEDLKNDAHGNKTQQANDMTVDVVKNGAMLLADEYIMGAALAAGPETMGASILLGAAAVGTSLVVNYVAEEIGNKLKKSKVVKKGIDRVEHAANNTFHTVEHAANNTFHTAEHAAKKRIDRVEHAANNTFHTAKNLVNHPLNTTEHIANNTFHSVEHKAKKTGRKIKHFFKHGF